MDVVVLGNGIAGVNAAQALRKLESDPGKLSIRVFGRERWDYYARIRLPEVFSGSVSPDDLRMYPSGWYRDRNIELHKGSEAVAIDRARKRVRFADGSWTGYDKLVLAIGADCFVPSLPGIGLAGLRAVREYDDAEWVRNWIEEGARSFSVIGGGLLGLEAAKHLADCGLEKIRVFEIAGRLLPRQLDERGAELLERKIAGYGIECHVGAKVEAFQGHAVLESLRLEGGMEYQSDAAIISMGIAPRVRIAAEAGLEVKRGIVVDEGMGTDDPDIYAIGDDAEYQGIVWGIIPAALEQAPVAAARILGDRSVRYAQTLPRNILKVAGIDLLSAGKVFFEKGEDAGYEILVDEDGDASKYRKVVLKEGKLAGVISLGDKKGQQWFLSRLGKDITREEMPLFGKVNQ